MTRVLIILTLVLSVLLAGMGWFYKQSLVANGALQESVSVLTEAAERAAARSIADGKALVARQAANAAQARKLAQSQRALADALAANREWADTPIPPTVKDSLNARD